MLEEQIEAALYEFKHDFGTRPNSITIGYRLADELSKQYCDNCLSEKTLEKHKREKQVVMVCSLEGIPFRIDNNNPYTLEVGYMVKHKVNMVRE